jgi:EAL domain-containing protein (putative c-di-GMP-specific phosphodiesterase class I)
LVLRTACADAACWPAHVKVAVNLSPLQFKHGNLLDTVLDALESSGLSPERLELEITETVLLENDTAHLTVMHQLMTIGVSFALDDFGTGYSSLGYLTTFPFSKIKIDRSFTRDLTKRTECAAIVLSVVTLADALDMTTVAEGIETRDQLELLRAAGINQVQGFLFGRPCPDAQLRFGCIDEAGPADESADGRRKGVAAHPGARAKMAAA